LPKKILKNPNSYLHTVPSPIVQLKIIPKRIAIEKEILEIVWPKKPIESTIK